MASSRKASMWFRTPSFCAKARRCMDFLHPDRIVVGANNERSAEVLQRIYEPLTSGSYYAQPGALAGSVQRRASRAADCDLDAKRGDHQARIERFSGHEDFVHQRGREPGRSGRCGHRRYFRGHRTRQPDRSQVSARRAGVRRLLLPEGRGRVSLGGAGAGRGFSTARRSAQDQRDAEGSLLQQGALGIVDAARQAAGRIWAWPSRARPTTSGSRRPSA